MSKELVRDTSIHADYGRRDRKEHSATRTVPQICHYPDA